MQTLTLTVGLPGSGKSTWANEEVQRKKKKTIVINRDDVRSTMYGGIVNYKYNKTSEKYVTDTQYHQAYCASQNKWDIIVADTNFNTQVEWTEWCKEHNYKLVIHDMFQEYLKDNEHDNNFFALQAYIKQCKKYNLNRLHSVPDDVIMRMAETYILPACQDLYVPDTTLPEAIIVDIDGTLADKGKRNPYDESKVFLDGTHPEVVFSIIAENTFLKRKVIIVSGRHETCREDTIRWLVHHQIPYTELHMRGEHDNRGDDVVKYDLFQGIKDRYNVKKVYDDRDRVVYMWRHLLGLKVFQVEEGNF